MRPLFASLLLVIVVGCSAEKLNEAQSVVDSLFCDLNPTMCPVKGTPTLT